MVKLVYYINNNYSGNLYVRPHFHTDYEIVYNLQGESKSNYKDKSYKITRTNGPALFVSEKLDNDCKNMILKENEFCIYPPFYTHDEYHQKSGTTIAINFSLDKDDSAIPLYYDKDDGTIKNILEKIITEMQEKKLGYLQMVDLYISEIILHISRKLPPKEENIDIIDQVIRHIDDYFASKIDYDDLAKSYGYNTDYLRHLFKEKTGLSPKNYIQEKRIVLAKSQISSTNLSLNDIAVNCGYDDYLQFSAYFKKKTGMSPTQYRTKKQSEKENK